MRERSDYQEEELADSGKRPNTIRYAAGLLMMTMVLTTFGLTMLYSASSSDVSAAATYFRSQLMWVGVGTAAGMAAFFGGYRFFCRYSWLWLAGCAVLLIWARFSREINGAHRWIILGSFRLQPSELAKIAVALFVSWYCAEYLRTFNDMRRIKQGIWELAAGVGGIVLLIFWGDDMGTSVLVASMAFLTMFAGNLKWPYFLLPAGLLPIIVVAIRLFDPMRWGRMTIFMDPEAEKTKAGYQLWNSLLALGSGSWYGMGLNNSRLKASYLPEAHTDFIISIIGEELGFVGVLTVILAYILWGCFAFSIAMSARNRMGMLLGCAVSIGVLFQAVINLGVVSGLFPTKGMPAPFISYGGSNMVCSLLAVGFLVSVAMDAAIPDYSVKLLGQLRQKLRIAIRED
ncbi:MAG: cell division protein FtsW [Lentisphaeria bacterium]|nr:cell division protein FtsW [Lentisphaeria bacterium]